MTLTNLNCLFCLPKVSASSKKRLSMKINATSVYNNPPRSANPCTQKKPIQDIVFALFSFHQLNHQLLLKLWASFGNGEHI